MELPAVQLEDHTRDLFNLSCQTHYPDHSLTDLYLPSAQPRRTSPALLRTHRPASHQHDQDEDYEPTTDGEPEPVARDKQEPESDQVCVLATSTVPVGLLVEFEGIVWKPCPHVHSRGDFGSGLC